MKKKKEMISQQIKLKIKQICFTCKNWKPNCGDRILYNWGSCMNKDVYDRLSIRKNDDFYYDFGCIFWEKYI